MCPSRLVNGTFRRQRTPANDHGNRAISGLVWVRVWVRYVAKTPCLECAEARLSDPRSTAVSTPTLKQVITSPEADEVRVGRVTIPLATAQRWISDYTNPGNVTAAQPYAYPAYDRYEHNRNDPRLLIDADLLAPTLLNVPLKIRSFYGLQRIRPQLEAGLANEDLGTPLEEIEDPARVAAMVAPLYAVLDDPETCPWNVQGTTLSKVLHRKRPESLVLHDRWVRACYLGEGAPVPRVKGRSWAEYMVAVTLAIGHNIRTQRAVFERLDAATSCPGELTHVRLLDILAWKSQGAEPSELVENQSARQMSAQVGS